MRSEALLSGLVRMSSGEPAPQFELELIKAPDSTFSGSPDPSPRMMHSDANGRFRFLGVTPGRYLLGTNIIGVSTSPAPPSYYPGQQTPEGAVPIEVKPGETVENLIFTLPDFGPQREIRVCAVDQRGDPVPTARIHFETGKDLSQFDPNLVIGNNGCAVTHAYAHAAFSIFATADPDLQSGQRSIPPGEDPAHVVLVLHPPTAP